MISVSELLNFVLVFFGCCLAMAVGIALIIALVNLIRMVRRVNKLLDDNAGHISKTIVQLPALAESFNKAGASVKANAEKIGNSISEVEGMLTGVPAAAGESNTLTTIVSIAESILKLIMGYFAKKEAE